MRARWRNDDGMSLIEVVISLGVLAFIALGVTTMVTTALHLSKLGQERSIATSLAAERVQQVASMRYQVVANYQRYALPEETAAAGPPPTFTTAYGGIVGYPHCRRVVELSYDTPSAGMLKVKVSVFWRHVGQPERGHTMIEFLHPGLD